MIQNEAGMNNPKAQKNTGKIPAPVKLRARAGQRTPRLGVTGENSTHHDKTFEDETDFDAGWWNTIRTGLAFLKWMQLRLENAENEIANQAERIALLEKLAMLDDLTGIYNRRGFFDGFSREIDRARRGQSEGGLLIVVDLDNFKSINDLYGHQAGDAALRLVARILKDNSRMMDLCARLGGDEFVLLMANTKREKALARAQNLIRQLNSLSLVWYGAEIPVRASLGLKDYSSADTPDDIFGAADSSMYAQKQNMHRANAALAMSVAAIGTGGQTQA